MSKLEKNLIAERLEAALALRDMKPAELARASNVNKATISQILAGERANTPAVIVAKLARALMVSADYLTGLASDPQPKALDLPPQVAELVRMANMLTGRRQRDLLLAARAYLADSADLANNRPLLMDNLLDLITEAGGNTSRDNLIGLLGVDFPPEEIGGGGDFRPN